MNDEPAIRTSEDYALLDGKTVFEGLMFRVERNRIRLPNGHETTHELVRYPGAVTIIPVLEEKPGEPELVVVEQFRTSVEGFIYEIPAGTLEEGEEPLGCARRELEEETGYRAERWTEVASLLQSPGVSPVRLTYFLAEGLTHDGEQNLEASECLSVKRLSVRRLVDALVFGREDTGIPPLADVKIHVAAYFLGARYGRPSP